MSAGMRWRGGAAYTGRLKITVANQPGSLSQPVDGDRAARGQHLQPAHRQPVDGFLRHGDRRRGRRREASRRHHRGAARDARRSTPSSTRAHECSVAMASRDACQCLQSPASRRQHRSRRHHPQRARRPPARSAARRRDRRRRRRRRHHRPSARGSPPHRRCRHRAADARARRSRSTSRWRRPTEMVGIALRHRPHAACIVPEKREERTTEGGLDAAGQHNRLKPMVARLRDAGIRVSLFIEADRRQLEAAVSLGAPVVELHTGAYCELRAARAQKRRARAAAEAAALCARARARVPHAGHGLSYDKVAPVAAHRRNARTQHRPFPGRRGDLRRPRRRDRARCAALMDEARGRGGPRHDPGHRQR